MTAQTAKQTIEIGLTDHRILDALRRYRFLSSEQVCRLFFSAGSLTYVRERLRRLCQAGFCARSFLPRPTQHGSAPSVFTLAKKGLNYLESQGEPAIRRFRPSEAVAHSYLFLSHTLALNDFLIAAERFGAAEEAFALAEVRY